NGEPPTRRAGASRRWPMLFLPAVVVSVDAQPAAAAVGAVPGGAVLYRADDRQGDALGDRPAQPVDAEDEIGAGRQVILAGLHPGQPDAPRDAGRDACVTVAGVPQPHIAAAGQLRQRQSDVGPAPGARVGEEARLRAGPCDGGPLADVGDLAPAN